MQGVVSIIIPCPTHITIMVHHLSGISSQSVETVVDDGRKLSQNDSEMKSLDKDM